MILIRFKFYIACKVQLRAGLREPPSAASYVIYAHANRNIYTYICLCVFAALSSQGQLPQQTPALCKTTQ
jgi:hypothetical protein